MMLAKRPRSVCLFGTSADPPTGVGGHRGIVMALSNLVLPATRQPSASAGAGAGAGENSCGRSAAAGSGCIVGNKVETSSPRQQLRFDEIRVIPVYRHMYNSKRGNQTSYNDRLEMCRLAFEGIDRVTVSDCERHCFHLAAKGLSGDDKVSVRVGTADLLDMLLEEEPSTDFSFALGADTFMDLTTLKWKRSIDLLDLVGSRLMVIYRQVEEEQSRYCEQDLLQRIDKVNKGACQSQSNGSDAGTNGGPAMLLNIPSLEAISSSIARTTTDEATLKKLLEPKVLQYIKQRQLYAFAGQSSTQQ